MKSKLLGAGKGTAVLLLAGLLQPAFAQGGATLADRLAAAVKDLDPAWRVTQPFTGSLSPVPSLRGVLEGGGYDVRIGLSTHASAADADKALDRDRVLARTAAPPSPGRTAWRDYRRANVAISIIADANQGAQTLPAPAAPVDRPTPAAVVDRVAGIIDGLITADVRADACVNELFPDSRPEPASGSDAFFYDVHVGCLPRVEQALAAGADPNRRDERSVTPLMRAVSAGHRAVAQALLRAGADPRATVGETGPPAFRIFSRPSSYYAEDLPRILANQLAILDDLIASGAGVEARDGQGRTLLLEAARMNYDDGSAAALLKGLLDRGADVSARDRDGRTAVILAVMHTHPDVSLKTLPVLLGAGADVTARDASGKTAVDYARERADRFRWQEWHRVLRLLADAGSQSQVLVPGRVLIIVPPR